MSAFVILEPVKDLWKGHSWRLIFPKFVKQSNFQKIKKFLANFKKKFRYFLQRNNFILVRFKMILHRRLINHYTKMKFSIKDSFGKCDQIQKKQRIWSHSLKKSFMENFIFCAVNFAHLLMKEDIAEIINWNSDVIGNAVFSTL